MKALARSYLWWPGLNKELEDCAKCCVACQSVKSAPAKAPLHPWLWPAKPWQRVHVDFAGPFLGKTFLIVVDAHSKWPEVIEMPSTTAPKTIAELRRLFAAYGLPEQLVSDNGPQFVAEEFAIFLKRNGVKHIRSSPYHPSSNGAAERFVRTFKQAMKAGAGSTPDISQRLANFLLTYRATPHATTDAPPCELFLGRRLRTRFDLLRPNRDRRVNNKQAAQKARHDYHAGYRELEVDQKVMARNWRPGPEWVPGEIVERLGPLTFKILTQAGQLWKRHIDHLRELGEVSEMPTETTDHEQEDIDSPSLRNTATETTPELREGQPLQTPETSPPVTLTTEADTRRYPARERHAPDRFTHSGLN